MEEQLNPRFGLVPLDQIRVDEKFWGEGAEPIVLEWLRENYDPEKMPRLATATIDTREDYWLLGWEAHDDYESLLSTIFGEEYAEKQLAHSHLLQQASERVLCPRCEVGFYTPYGVEVGDWDIAPHPALSRTTRSEDDAKIYVCSWCGTDEAIEEAGGRLTPPEEWPIKRPGSFGFGHTKWSDR